MSKNKLKAIDFFCSGGGMTNGMIRSGIEVIAGIDFDNECKETYEKNNPGTKFILADIFELEEKKLKKELSIKKNDKDLILIGCSPCQYWSIIRTEKKKSEKSKDLLGEFHRFVKFFNPGYVVVENVPGIVSRKEESGLNNFIADLKERGYTVESKVINLNDYGVPQTRKRFSLVATRVGKKPIFPEPNPNKLKVKDFLGVKNGFKKIDAGYKDNSNFNHSCSNLSEKNIERLKGTALNGGNALWWRKHNELGRERYRGDGFTDNYSRMSWEKPAPTITTKFFSISNGRFAHPEENRAISIREGATLQTFPKDYVFHSRSLQNTARMIGNAVPPKYAESIGTAIIKTRIK